MSTMAEGATAGALVRTGYRIVAVDTASPVFKRVSKTAIKALQSIAKTSKAMGFTVATGFVRAKLSAEQFQKELAEVQGLTKSSVSTNKKLAKSMDQVAKASKEAGGKAGALFGKIASGAAKAIKVIVAMALAITGLVVAALVKAARAAIQFESSIARVSTLVDSAVVSNEALSESVLKLSAEFGASPTKTAEALYQAISSGAKAGAEANKLLTTAFKLAVGGTTDIFTAVDGLTTVINAYGASMDTAGIVSDAFFVTIALGKTTAEELSKSLGAVASGAASAGVGLDELLAAVAAGSKILGNTERIVTGLNQAFVNIQKPTDQAKKEIKRLGLTMKDFSIQGDGLIGMLGRLSGSSKFTSQSLVRLFESSQAQKAITSLLTNDLKDFRFALDAVRNSAGASEKAFDKMAKTTGFLVERAKSLVEVLKIVIGELFQSDVGAGIFEPINEALAISIAFFQEMSLDSVNLKNDVRALTKDAIVLATRGFSAMASAAALTVSAMLRMQIVASTLKRGVFDIAAEIGKWESKTGAAVKVINLATGEVSDLEDTTKKTSAAMAADVNRMVSSLERFDKMAAGVVAGIDALANELETKIGGAATDKAIAKTNTLADTLTKLRDIINQNKKATTDASEESIKAAVKEEEINLKLFVAERDRLAARKRALEELVVLEAKAKAEGKRARDREAAEIQQLGFDAVDKAGKAAKQGQDKIDAQAKSAANSLASSVGGAFLDLATKARTFEEVALGALRRIGESALQLALSTAFQLLFKAILAPATGGTSLLGAIFGGNRGGIVPMALGGLVGGGAPQNQDTQLIAATSGERVIPVRETRAIDRGEAVLGRPAAVAAAAGPAAPQITQHFNLFTIPTRVQMDRMNKESIQPSNRNLRMLGFEA